MNLDYVFGPVVATDTLININLQFHRVLDKQEKVHGWAWTTDDDDIDGEMSRGNYDIYPHKVIDDICRTLRTKLEETLDEWYDTHPKAAQAAGKVTGRVTT